ENAILDRSIAAYAAETPVDSPDSIDYSAARQFVLPAESSRPIMQQTLMSQLNYNRVARIYETLGYIYSGRQIYDAKASQMAEIRPRDRVLYAGVGPGEDALLAARQGARVTCLDLSAAMLRQAESRLAREGLSAEFVQGDVLQHDRLEYYDVVVA